MLISNEFSLIRSVQYHETDAMGIMHHANYIKWMEEARYAFLLESGTDWSVVEKEKGLMIPVLSVAVDYKHALRFGDTVTLICRVVKFNGVKIEFEYEFVNADGNTAAKGKSSHGFIDKNFKPVALQNELKECYTALTNLN